MFPHAVSCERHSHHNTFAPSPNFNRCRAPPLRCQLPRGEKLVLSSAAAQVRGAVGIGAAWPQLAPTALPMPTEHLLEARSDKRQDVVRHRGDRVVIGVRHLGAQGRVLEPCTWCAAVVREEPQRGQAVELHLAACYGLHGPQHARDGAQRYRLPGGGAVLQKYTEHEEADVLDTTMSRVPVHQPSHLLDGPSADVSRGAVGANCRTNHDDSGESSRGRLVAELTDRTYHRVGDAGGGDERDHLRWGRRGQPRGELGEDELYVTASSLRVLERG
mmetsp:Transcript_127563/g.285372  ORF Transcript_127563/g.285372 Transcript_127563/m.285372 type:complete len:274 (-) Transcript_127563:336-1157(-)